MEMINIDISEELEKQNVAYEKANPENISITVIPEQKKEKYPTVNQLRKQFPFLNSILDETEWSPKSRVRFTLLIDKPVKFSSPWHDGCVRYTSSGEYNNSENVSSHYAGCYDTCLNNPKEILGNDIGNGTKIIKAGMFYAIADSLEYYRSRSLTVWVSSMPNLQLIAASENKDANLTSSLLQE
jgi:hypothetical protein